MKINKSIFFNLLTLLLFILFSYKISTGQELISKDTLKGEGFTLNYEISDQQSLLPINIKLYDTVGNKYFKNTINDFSKIVNDNLYNFNIHVIDNRFILEYVEVLCGHSYFTHYHVFEKMNDKFYFTKEYIKTSDRNGFSFIGIANNQNVNFQFYIPKEIENDNKVTISSFDGYQEGNEPEPFLPIYEKRISEFSKAKLIDSLEIYCDIFVLDYYLSKLYHISKNQIAINNIGYYLSENHLYNESAFVLNNLLQHFPNRTVAYINLGDAYWGLEEMHNAKAAYQKYIELMKANGKESKIPQRIFDRMK